MPAGTSVPRIRRLAGWLLLGAALHARGALVEDVQRDTEWLARYASRVPGTEGHREAQRDLLARVRGLAGVQVWTQEFPVVAPVVKRAVLLISEGPLAGEHAVFPIWPDLVRLKTTPRGGLHGQLLYVGKAGLDELPARSLRGNIAVMEMSACENWKQPFSMGASAVLLLGGPDDRAMQPEQQALYMPRYYVPEGRLAEAMRRKEIREASVFCDAAWQTVTARNIYALVNPAAGGTSSPPIAVVAPYDAMSVVMGLAPGADNAVDAAFVLNVLRETADSPATRPLLFCFVDAYGFNQLGVRQMLTMLTATPEDKTREDYAKIDLEQLEQYETTVAKLQDLGDGSDALDKLGDKSKYQELQRYFKDELGPEILHIKETLGDLRLALGRAPAERKAELQTELNTKWARLQLLNSALGGVLTREPLPDDLRPTAQAAWQAVRQRVRAQRSALRDDMRYFEKLDVLRTVIRKAMGEAAVSNRLVTFVVGIDLSDAGTSCGPGLTGAHLLNNETAQARDFLRWLKPILKDSNDRFMRQGGPFIEQALNRDAVSGPEDPSAFNVGNVGLITAPAASFQVPGVTWLTLDADRVRVDTPQDRADRLDWGRLGPQIVVTSHLLRRLFDDAAFAPEVKAAGASRPKWRQPRGSVVSESLAETLPRTPMPGYLATLVGGSNTMPGPKAAAGLRRQEFAWTGPDGRFRFPPLPGQANGSLLRTLVQAFAFDEDGRISGALSDSASMIAGRVSALVNLGEGPSASPARVVCFPCRELNGPEFFDPRFLEPLSQFSLIDVARGGAPKRYHFSIHAGQMFGLLMPGTSWQLRLRAGSGANRMVLMNIDPRLLTGTLSLREAIRAGYRLDEALPSIPAHLSAQDLYRVDEWRADRFNRAGISSVAILELHKETAAWLAAADDALARDDGAALHRAAAAALGTEIRAYDALLATGDDVTRGAIFLMILLVPFSVAMERLLFACARIGHRISMGVAIFLVMTLILWSFHPAFRITTQPVVIIMAFAILLLSLMVITMILRKFEADLEEIRSGRAEASGAQTSRGGVIGSAVWLGIANMRKRKLRTALTGTTIVLITFALLCFSSSTYYQNKRQFALAGAQAPSPGVLIRQIHMRAMADRALPTVANLLGGLDALGDKTQPNRILQVAPRYWWASSQNANWRIHVRHPVTGKQVSLKAALGLSAAEDKLTQPGRFMKNWERFAQGGGCYLSAAVASSLGVTPGGKVAVAGRELELIDVFDATKVEGSLKMLDGQSLLPFDYTVQREEVRETVSLEAEVASGAGIEPETEVSYVGGNEVIILPADFTRRAGGTLRSIAVGTDTAKSAEDTALALMKVLAFPMYYGEGNNVKVVVSTPLIPKPPRKLLIPILIAALIIFNTMLNSVTERKGEIHIYTSLGLAPRHVGMLFLAEAVTYGLMGSIFGYVVGQGLATVLNHLSLMGGITLNYSGTNVMMTMSLVLIVVILSAIVPAVMASKLATPSKDMRWQVPQPQDGVIRDVLPFTVTRRAATGLVAFIHEYMDAHRDGGLGHFTADKLELFGPKEGSIAAVSGTVWLAPYDLSVRQDFRIEIRPDVEEICGIHIALTYGSGQVKTWWRLNQTFLGDVRRQLLGWRNVKPERIMEYIKKAQRDAPP